MSRLRLFPLRTVLFPGMDMDLQVFEDRYRLLVAECIEAREPFGVALIKDGPEVGGNATPHAIGCTARIRSVAPSRDGRLLLKVRGDRRFRITEVHDDQPYLSADVEYPVDQAAEVPEATLTSIRERLQQWYRLRDTIAHEYQREVELPGAAGELADHVGAMARGLITDRQLQPLLAALNVRRRIELADEILTSMVTSTHAQAAAVVAQRWGSVERRN